MHLILAHEQADFDSVAALVASRLAEPSARAVLPRRLNRNVRAFMTLYGDGLPLIEFDDLPREPVDRVTLVDTQSLPSTRGVSAETRVHVIDHHPREGEIEPGWTYHVEEVGATTTLLVEALQEGHPELNPVESTLLLLGIYEDTGSLSYGSTSPRDVRACAWLLESGASLAIAVDFLNHPLSAGQRQLYDRLLESAETHQFHGLSVVIACASAEGLTEEISTLAHKLRDLFDPAGLFVLVALDGNIQLVARSSTEAIDVGRVAQHFGGGGHDRAAAALIRMRPIEGVRSELIELLQKSVRPDRTVGEIMSRGPQLLEPRARVSEAAERMQRFGHEGYPVVEDGRVVGLLTRRAVDRAMAHGLGSLPVSQVMDAGTLTVLPTDSVQHLQRVMIQHDWGQVPVVDPDDGAIIAIVTRTDLLKTLASAGAPATPNLGERLRAALPPGRYALLELIGKRAEREVAAVYIVGGFVRDLLLGTPSVDFDMVVEGDAVRLARSLAEAYGGRTSSHHRFGTAKWRLDRRNRALVEACGGRQPAEALPETLDFVSARTEFYTHPTALPSVERGSIKLDLHRRDFTINTLALRLDGRFFGALLDPWGGQRDLEQRLVRVLHSISFVDDPTRMLRAVRLEQRLGFSIEARTLELMAQALPLLDRVSGERIRNELVLIFREACLGAIMERLEALGLLEAIHTALTWDGWLAERFASAGDFRPPASWQLQSVLDPQLLRFVLWVYRLPESEAMAACRRLSLPLAIEEPALEANRLGSELSGRIEDVRPSQWVARWEGYHEAALAAAWLALAERTPARAVLERYLAEWRHVMPATDGNALREAGLAPGPEYKRILWTLRSAWVDGEIRSAAEEAVWVARLLNEARARGG
ncbi:MAG: hypothetical protein A2Y93_05975 [Chloroflexi bacterium RBG_13_68_17]|nr:MAG: hypothetical protein A2Y93_05975 [Chloroflexi bacterium RBG_13_68_17]